MESKHSVEGTGLGMSITNNLIKLMHGKISIESDPGNGSEFTISLPQRKIGEDTLGKEMTENLRLFRTSSRARTRRAQMVFESMPYGNVLIVDDVDSNIYVAKGLMAPYEMSIDSADRGSAAIEKVKNGNVYDVIFMDHMMPEMDGIETTKRLRAMGYTEPIVALTASAVAGQVDMFLDNGFDDYISKPIDIRQMNVIMNKYVRDKQLPAVIETVRRFKENEEEKKKTKGGRKKGAVKGNTGSVKNKKIAGLDILRGIKRYHDDEDAYIRVLNAYSIAVRDMLGYIKDVDGDDLDDYRIRVHGIKGASFDVYADETAENAEKLEKAAIAKDFAYITQHNSSFIDTVNEFLDTIDNMLLTISAEKTGPDLKQKKDKIDSGLLDKLLIACKDYDMSGVDDVMEEIELYSYDSDNKLATWLRENVDLINFSEIIERVTEERGE